MNIHEESQIKHLASSTTFPCPACDMALNFSTVKPLSTVGCPGCGHTLMVPGQLDHYELT